MTIHDVNLDTFVKEWEAWHRQVETRLADPHGFLAITSIHWLTSTPERFDDAAGAWWTGEDGVSVHLDEGEELLLDGRPLQGTHHFGVIPERASVNVAWGDAVLEVAKRAGHDILRPRHPDHPLRLAFRGTPAYPPLPRWQVPGCYQAFDQPRPTTVGAAVEGLQHVYDAPGRVDFDIDGRALSLTIFPGHADSELIALFTDATSGTTTYGAVRVVTIPPTADDGAVVIDFNRARNLPCAYTDLATCPLPPAENRLPVAIEAGEQIPYEKLGGG